MAEDRGKRRLTILFDADDVVENLMDCWVALLNQRYGTQADPEDSRDWDVSKLFPTLTREQVYAPVAEDEVWGMLSPIPGSREVLRRLQEEGHQLYMVTASDYRSCRAKVEALLAMFPFLDWGHIIITSHKQLVKGDVLIDDGPHNLTGGDYFKILMDRPYNRAYREKEDGAVRVYGWEEVYSIIQALAQGKDPRETK